MKKVTFYCDRCKKEITQTVYQLATIWFDAAFPEPSECDYGADLCEECYRKVDDAVLAEIQVGNQLKQIEDARERKLAKTVGPKVTARKPIEPKVKIDLGKVGALRDAGWTWEKIGEEFHCSAQTVINHWNKYRNTQEVETNE